MITTSRGRALRLGIAAVLLTAAAGCAEEVAGEASAASPSASSPSALPSGADPSTEPADGPSDELAAGLLPAAAFGPDAEVTTLDAADLAASGPAGLPPGATVTPAECAEGLGAIQPTPGDLGAVVAQTAETPAQLTVQVLAEDETIEAGSSTAFDDLLARCSHIELTAPDGSSGTMDLRELQVPAVGEVSQGLAFTLALTTPDGTGGTVACLLAVAVEDQRLVLLQQLAPDGAPLDEAAFSALFEQAYEQQRDA